MRNQVVGLWWACKRTSRMRCTRFGVGGVQFARSGGITYRTACTTCVRTYQARFGCVSFRVCRLLLLCRCTAAVPPWRIFCCCCTFRYLSTYKCGDKKVCVGGGSFHQQCTRLAAVSHGYQWYEVLHHLTRTTIEWKYKGRLNFMLIRVYTNGPNIPVQNGGQVSHCASSYAAAATL